MEIKIIPYSFDHVVYIWVLNWTNYLNRKKILWRTLSSLEQKKARQFSCFRDQDQYIVIRGVLRILIANLLKVLPNQLMFEYNPFGKPSLINQPLEFNLSHSKDQVVYAFCKTASLGVDIQHLNFSISVDQLRKRYFSECENNILSTLKGNDKKEVFFQGWVQKESIAKAFGFGLNIHLEQVEVSLKRSSLACVKLPSFIPSQPRQLFSHPIHIEGLSGALALNVKKGSVNIKQFKKIDFFE